MDATQIPAMTAAGRATMLAIGQQRLSFFDDGVVEGSGIWGEVLTSGMGHKSSGVINRLKALGLLDACIDQDSTDGGAWWWLTALGADVAKHLAAEAAGTPAVEAPAAPSFTTKVGPKWTYIFDADGNQLAEVRTGQAAAVIAALQTLA